MKTIKLLLYYPPNKRSIGVNAIVKLLSSLDNIELFVLTQDEHGQLHEDLRYRLPSEKILASKILVDRGVAFYYGHVKRLIKVCKQHKIDIVLSHLQQGNLVALAASVFLYKVRFIFFRHHFHYYKKFKLDYLKISQKEEWGERIINIFSNKIVVPSTTVKDGMIEYERVKSSKIHIIPYIYNFDEYPKIDQRNVVALKEKYKAHLLLLMSSRLIEAKRHGLVVEVIDRLVKKNLDIKMIMVDDGPLKDSILNKVQRLGLENRIFHVGYTDRILDYMAASDLLVHPSLSEASNSSVKEIGLAGRTAIVCRGVGDFDDYIVDKRNGFLIDPLNTEIELEMTIDYAYKNKEILIKMGNALRKKVMDTFSPNTTTIALYKKILQ